MNNDTKRLLFRQVRNIKKEQMKEILGRKRLKYSYSEICLYLGAFLESHTQFVSFKKVYKKLVSKKKVLVTYEGFMYNLGVLGALFEHVFKRQEHLIKKATRMILDTSFLVAKQNYCLRPKDKPRIAVRPGKLVCGYKVLLLCDETRRILFADLVSIKSHDSTFFEKCSEYFYDFGFSGEILADKGFSSEKNRKLAKMNNQKLICPYKKNQQKQLSQKDQKIYRKTRYKIENIFKVLKDIQEKPRLIIKNQRRISIIRAKLFLACLIFNKEYSSIFALFFALVTLDSLILLF